MANINGQFDVASYYNVTARSPLDTRMLVRTLNDLTAETSWDDEHHPPYKGMLVVVQDSGDVYTLIDEENVHKIDAWKKQGSNTELDSVDSKLVMTDEIIVKGGPLSSILNAAGINKIESGNLHELLKSLFCTEDWPKQLVSTKGTLTRGTIGGISIAAASPVEIGSNIKFTISQGSAERYNKTVSSVTGFINGYSTLNNNTIESSASKVEKDWTIQKGTSNYTLVINNGTPLTGTTTQSGTYETTAKLGSNVCSATSEGYVTYTGTIEGIPVLYAVSSLGNTSDDYKTEAVSGDNVTITSGGSTSASKTVTGVYPVYHNWNSPSLLDDASKKNVQTSASFEFSEIESEEASGKRFIFEYPAHKTINSFTKKVLPEKYNYYTNISGNALLDSATTSHGKLTSSVTLTVPAESAANNRKHFVLEFTSFASISKIEKYNPSTKDWNILNSNVYRVSSRITKNGHTYSKFETIGGFVGEGTYRFTFNTSSSYISDITYTISDPFNKEINGTNYQYRRLTTDGTSGIVSRKITLNSTLDS